MSPACLTTPAKSFVRSWPAPRIGCPSDRRRRWTLTSRRTAERFSHWSDQPNNYASDLTRSPGATANWWMAATRAPYITMISSRAQACFDATSPSLGPSIADPSRCLRLLFCVSLQGRRGDCVGRSAAKHIAASGERAAGPSPSPARIFGGQCNGCKVTATPGRLHHGPEPGNRFVEKHRDHGRPARDVNRPAHHHGERLGGDRCNGDYGGLAESVRHCRIAGELQFAYTIGQRRVEPFLPAQSIQITNSGGGTLAWTATANRRRAHPGWPCPLHPATRRRLFPYRSRPPASAPALTRAVEFSILCIGGLEHSVLGSGYAYRNPGAPALAVAPQALTSIIPWAVPRRPRRPSLSQTRARGALSWTASTSDYWLAVSPASGALPPRCRSRSTRQI